MNTVEYDLSFLPSRSLAREIAVGRRMSAPVWAADFSANAYFRCGRSIGVAGLISTSRASAAFALDTNGAYRRFAEHEPAIIDGVGLDIQGQWVAKNADLFDFSVSSDWGNPGGYLAIEEVPSCFPGETAWRLANTGGTYAQRNQACGTFSSSKETLSFVAERGTSGHSLVAIRDLSAVKWVPVALYNWATDTIEILDEAGASFATVASEVLTESGPSGGRLVRFSVTGLASGPGRNRSAFIYPTMTSDTDDYLGGGTANADSAILHQAQYVEAGWAGPIIPATGIRDADTIADPDFSALVSAYALDSGFAVGSRIALDRLSDDAPRCVWSVGTDVGNHARLDITTSGTAKFTLRKAGLDVLTLESGAFAAPGDKDIAVTAKDGGWALTATDVAGDGDAGTYGLPALADFRYGSQFGDANYLNGTLKSLVVGRAA